MIAIELASASPATEEFVVTPDGDGGTLVTMRVDVRTPGGPLKPLVERIFVSPNLAGQVRGELEKMRDVLESGQVVG